MKHLKFKTIFKDDHSVIMSRRGEAIDETKPLFTTADLLPQPEKQPASDQLEEKQPEMDGFFAGLFDLVDEEKNKKQPKQK